MLVIVMCRHAKGEELPSSVILAAESKVQQALNANCARAEHLGAARKDSAFHNDSSDGNCSAEK
jgi:hypothetical protein